MVYATYSVDLWNIGGGVEFLPPTTVGTHMFPHVKQPYSQGDHPKHSEREGSRVLMHSEEKRSFLNSGTKPKQTRRKNIMCLPTRYATKILRFRELSKYCSKRKVNFNTTVGIIKTFNRHLGKVITWAGNDWELIVCRLLHETPLEVKWLNPIANR